MVHTAFKILGAAVNIYSTTYHVTQLTNSRTMIFVAVFIFFLTQCVQFSKIRKSDRLSDVVVPQCTQKISGIQNVLVFLFTLFTIVRAYQCVVGVSRLMRMHDFYHYCLGIPDGDIQTVSWPTVVSRLMALRDANARTMTQRLSPLQRKWLSSQSKERMSAHDIANRLMRRENYLIALFNKEILDFTLPIPLLGGTQLFSHSLEWNINYCILDLIFGPNNQVHQYVLLDSNRRQLSDALQRRFVFAAVMNFICAPVIFSYLLAEYFFQYFNVSSASFSH